MTSIKTDGNPSSIDSSSVQADVAHSKWEIIMITPYDLIIIVIAGLIGALVARQF